MSCAAMGNRSDTAQVKLCVLADETSEISKQTRAPRSPLLCSKRKEASGGVDCDSLARCSRTHRRRHLLLQTEMEPERVGSEVV